MSFGDRNLASAIAYRQLGMRLNLDISRSEPITVVRCRGRIVFGEEYGRATAGGLDLLKETRELSCPRFDPNDGQLWSGNVGFIVYLGS
jgi:hypothetical protein